MAEITFRMEGGGEVSLSALPGEILLDVARKANVAIDAPCSGNGSCGKCRVRLLEGTLNAPPNRHLTQQEMDAGWRLACASQVEGDAVILVPDIAGAYRNRIRSADLSSPEETAAFTEMLEQLSVSGLKKGCGIKAVDVAMEEPSLEDPDPDCERLSLALQGQLGVSLVHILHPALQTLPSVLRESGFSVSCAVESRGTEAFVYDVSGKPLPACGIAIDIGTTTVSAFLADLETGKILAKATAGNGQIRYGADVINRIIEASRPGGREKLREAIVKETLNPLLHLLCTSAKIPEQRIIRVCVAGNTTMNHLFLGIDADPIRKEPYVPAFFEMEPVSAGLLGLEINPCASVLLAPNVGSYVGGDITAGALASRIWDTEALSLLIDLGTNGELVLGSQDFLMCCACSAGPAFEGGDISCGMRATDGAVEACRVDRETLEPSFSIIGEGPPVGLCGSGLIDVICELYCCGALDSKGKFVRQNPRIRRDAYGIGSYVLAFREETQGTRDLELTEIDIDNFIRAKGAIFSAIQTMLTAVGLEVADLEQVYVAGGIGSGINMKNAVTIGMLPDIPLERYDYIGNSSLSGAGAMLLSADAAGKVREVGRNMTYLELSADSGYMDAFVAACFLPHTDLSLFPTAAGRRTYDPQQ